MGSFFTYLGFFFMVGGVRGVCGALGSSRALGAGSSAAGGGSSGFSSGLHSPADTRNEATLCHRSPCLRSTLYDLVGASALNRHSAVSSLGYFHGIGFWDTWLRVQLSPPVIVWYSSWRIP